MKTMGKFSILECILLCCGVLCVYCQLPIYDGEESKVTGESVPLILKFLNDDVDAIISYKSGTIKHSQLKGDILEVDITATVACKSPNEQCNYDSAECRGLLFIRPNAELQVISVDCNPNFPVEEPLALPVKNELCEGCFVEVDVNGEGVEQLANNVIQHVESEKGKRYYLIEVLKVQRQVTNGVNFIITVLIGRPPSGCVPNQACERDKKEDMYCVVKFFQEPGYYSPKNIMSNNCTQTQTFLPFVPPKYQPNDANKIMVDDAKTDYVGKDSYLKKVEMSENDILKDLISQIVPSDEFMDPVKNLETSSINNVPDGSSQSVIVSTFQEVLATEDEPISVVTDTSSNQDEMNSSIPTETLVKIGSTVTENQQMVLGQADSRADVTDESIGLNEGKVADSVSGGNPEVVMRETRNIPGGKQEMDINDPELKEYTDKAVEYLNSQLNRGDDKIKIGKILKATYQVVSGFSYDITVELSDCSIKTCQSVPKVLDINVWSRPWLNSTIIKFKFDEQIYSFNAFDASKSKSRSKREYIAGGWRKREDNEDPMIMKHLNNLLTNLDSQSGMKNKLKIKEVLSTSTQVVAGINWLIRAKVSRTDCLKSDDKAAAECGEDQDSFETVCNFKFWEKLPNENRVRELGNVEIECEEPKLSYRTKREIRRRNTRQVLVGGHNPLSKDDPRISKHLNKLLPQLDNLSDKEHKLKIKNVIAATSQVVAGTNWNIKAAVSLSDCKKSESKSSADCGDNEKTYETICDFKFWERLPDGNGLRKLDNVEIECEDSNLTKRDKREIIPDRGVSKESDHLPGGLLNVDENHPDVQEFISESLRHMDLNSPYDTKFKVKEIVSTTRQIVSGSFWRIKVAIVLSDCDKQDLTDSAQCGELPEAEPKKCLIKVWNRPWIEQGREFNITCDKQKTAYSFKSGTGVNVNAKHYAAFQEFERKYERRYINAKERLRRFAIFQNNMDYAKYLNENEQGTATYGATKFADLSREEFSKGLGYRPDLRGENEVEFSRAEVPDVKLPDSFDWRDKNAVAEVKDQGSCGSCWAFSVTGNVEGQYAIKYGELLEFSEQELVDCDTEDQGCNGGLMDNAYRQIEKLGGLEEEKQYPYDARDEKCHFNKSLARVQLAGAVNISQDETEMAKWLVKNGPISIAINANAMQLYMGGVSHPWKILCNPKNLDHGVLIVGYGVHTYPKFRKSLPYWIVKNSWGKSWGEQGYYRVYRGDGTCGVNQTPSSAILK